MFQIQNKSGKPGTLANDPRNVEPSMPHLPVEIWSRIFEFATRIPGTLEIDDYAAIYAFTRDYHGICLSNRFKASMQTKLSVTLVCKYWNAIVQPVLFQHLQITGGAHACVMANVLDGIKRRSDDQEGPAKWTLRIDFVLEGVHSWDKRHEQAMSRIFKRCQNLLCFSTVLSGDDPRTYGLSTFIQHLGHNTRLKRLEVRVNNEVLQAMNDFLSNQLEILWLLPHTEWNILRRVSTVISSYTRISMPNLRALIADVDSSQHIKKFDLPRLRACISGTHIGHYPNINKNTVEYLSARQAIDLSVWPNLTSISFSALSLFGQEITTFQNTGIECIMIEEMDFKRWKFPDHRNIPWFIEESITAFRSPGLFPRLRCIKIPLPILSRTHRQHWLPEEEKPCWSALFQACHDREVQIEVSEGAMEWTEDYWTRYGHDEVLDILFGTIPVGQEEWSIYEESGSGAED